VVDLCIQRTGAQWYTDSRIRIHVVWMNQDLFIQTRDWLALSVKTLALPPVAAVPVA